ncbi:hypothetical protein Glove_42g23 [Diversispora epigaea]|uniref:Uncharacterized protein n=1 Tax=Diversispora epigaea TaxID=1348612 RepID=A0A397JF27_9GLOM|nr:hypothetical protein Glove_42g23 [Diversispora epigaea]
MTDDMELENQILPPTIPPTPSPPPQCPIMDDKPDVKELSFGDELQLEKYFYSSNNENDTEKEAPDKIMSNFMEKCHEIKNRAKELLEKARKKDGTEIKLDYNIKIQIIRGFIYMKRINSEAYFRKRDEKNAKNKAKCALTDVKHRFSEINYRKFLLDYKLNAIKSDEPKYHKISLAPLEEFFNTAPQEFIDPLRKYHDFDDIVNNKIKSSNNKDNNQDQFRRELLLQRLRHEKHERDRLEDMKINRMKRKKELESKIEEKSKRVREFNAKLKQYIKNPSKRSNELLGSLSSSFSNTDINDIRAVVQNSDC